MKMSVLYFSKSGCTKEMAETIVKGMESINGVETKVMSISEIDDEFVKESMCVVIGTPTYYTNLAAEVKMWLDTQSGKYALAGKLGGAFATANFVHGGAHNAIQNILTHLTFMGMLIYSGGNACGNPPIHIGPVAVSAQRDEYKPVFEIYGQRMAKKATELFNK